MPDKPLGDSAYLERLLSCLVEILTCGRLSPIERAEAGRALAQLGDPRPEVTTLDGMEFCLVPRGPFWMGESQDARYEDEKPQHQVDLPYDFWLAHYPVTVAQYRAFVEASGRPPRDENRLRGLPNHPVVDVTWHDAQAFCTWLTGDWQKRGWLSDGWAVRLPSEAEWEKAARGGQQIVRVVHSISSLKGEMQREIQQENNPNSRRVFPWGDEPDPNLANYADTHIGNTSAVGCFPDGASPYGCEDMSGNVWEWTRSVYEQYPYDPNGGRESLQSDAARVLRGGGFNSNEYFVRCAYRLWYVPDALYRFIGFRVVLSPS